MQTITPDILLISIGALALIVIVLLVWVITMHSKLKRFLVGIDSDHLGDSLTHLSKNLDELHVFRANMEAYLNEVEKRLKKSIRSVHTVRFNPFKGTGGGGNQSFSTTFLNEEGDGVIISSLYSREHVSVFSKPLRSKGSDYELSDEERESLDEAMKKLG